MKPTGIAIISLTNIYRKQDKTKQTYYLLTYQLQRTLTSKYLQLTKQPLATLKNNRLPLFLFNAKKQFATSLITGVIYWIAYTTCQKKKTQYLHLQDWRTLGDKLTVKRSWNLLSQTNHE